MSSAVLYQTTRIGTIEIAVSDRVTAKTEIVGHNGWAREFRPRTTAEWSAKLKGMDKAEKRRERRHREREAPMADVNPDLVVEPTDRERDPVEIEARREKLETGAKRDLPAKDEAKDDRPYPNAGAFFLLSVGDKAARRRGAPANTAPGTPYSSVGTGSSGLR
jgi:hypothetical protein